MLNFQPRLENSLEMKLSSICLSASIVAVAMGQRRPNRKKNKNKNRKPTKPALIEVPSQERF